MAIRLAKVSSSAFVKKSFRKPSASGADFMSAIVWARVLVICFLSEGLMLLSDVLMFYLLNYSIYLTDVKTFLRSRFPGQEHFPLEG